MQPTAPAATSSATDRTTQNNSAAPDDAFIQAWAAAPVSRAYQTGCERARAIAAATASTQAADDHVDYFFEESFKPVVSFDYDGDGQTESIWHASDYHEGTTDLWIEVFTVKNNQVVPYPLPFDRSLLSGIANINNDGRPDLLLHRMAYTSECASSFDIEHYGIVLAAESLVGGAFSLTTSAAEHYLKKQERSIFKSPFSLS